MGRSRWKRAALAAILVAGVATAFSVVSSSVATPKASAAAYREAGSGGNCTGKNVEHYYWVSAISTLPLFVANDFPVLFRTAKQLGVCATVVGPSAFDLAGDVAAIEETCARHPAGVMVVGLDASLASAINKCIAERVPTDTIDVDVPNSKRLAFVGGDFTSLGTYIADNMIAEQKRIHHVSSGEIAMTMKVGVPSNNQIEAGIETEMKAKGWKWDGVQDDQDTAEGGSAAASALITAHPNLVGLIAIGSEPGPGVVQAVNEAGKKGKILVTAGQHDVAFAQKIKSGELASFFGPQRVNITQFGLIELYQFNHSVGSVSGLNKWQFPPIAPFIDVGAYAVDSTNVDRWIKANK